MMRNLMQVFVDLVKLFWKRPFVIVGIIFVPLLYLLGWWIDPIWHPGGSDFLNGLGTSVKKD